MTKWQCDGCNMRCTVTNNGLEPVLCVSDTTCTDFYWQSDRQNKREEIRKTGKMLEVDL